MKRIYSILMLFVAVFFAACEADKDIVTLPETVTPGTIGALSGAEFILTMDAAENEFQEFSWTEVDFGFNTVATYTVQFDAQGSNFASPVDVVAAINSDHASVSIGDFNELLLSNSFLPDAEADIQFRVKVTIHASVTPVFTSNTVSATVTPYATSWPPIYMCGKPTGGWDWAKYTYKTLKSTGPNVWEGVVYFVNSGSEDFFRFFRETNWNAAQINYTYFTTVDADLGDQGPNDHNFVFLAATGYYKIVVNLNTKTVTLDPAAEPVLFMTGGALGGWDWSTNYVQLTWKDNGIFEATTDFSNDIFRFFAQGDWNPTSYNYSWFKTVDPLFELNANDGDKNFRFLGTPGSYKVTVDMVDKIVDMDAAK